MRKILGLDLGTNSIGWAVVNEAENSEEKSSIVRLGVRVNPLSVDERNNFESGKSITTNADRTQKRSMRRNLQRYKLRRKNLIEVLKNAGWITDETVLAEQGNFTTFQTLRLRAKAVTEEISLTELARVLLMINKKRGYRSSRKAKNEEDGQFIDSMDIAKYLYENNITPGQYCFRQLSEGKYKIPDFYRSDLAEEFDRIWEFQKQFYPDILTDVLKENLKDKNEKQTWAICASPFNIVGINRTVKGKDLVKENYKWRVKALSEKLSLEELAVVLQKINGNLKGSSGYLGNISDRSKELYFNNITIGQYLVSIIDKNPNQSLKNIVFYRQDYLDEFERIWTAQAEFHPELTSDLKNEIRDIVIFYQRPLKSQKGLVSICELEGEEKEITVNGKKKIKIIGPKVCPKSSPWFQEFKIWQIINNLKVNGNFLEQEDKEKLAQELSIKEKLSKSDVLKLLYGKNIKGIDLNFKEIEGNRTQAALFNAYARILEVTGHIEAEEILKKSSADIMKTVTEVFTGLGYNTDILCFDTTLPDSEIERQPMFRLWHLLYSYEGDKSRSGNESLVGKVAEITGCEKEYARIIAGVTFDPDYGSLSARAIKKILPYMKEGNEYSVACEYAGYRHSKRSLTKEEIENKSYKDRLDPVLRNSLRNPVVEKILNQMVNVVNAVIDEYGKPDEIRIELARELKKSKKEREQAASDISTATKENDRVRQELQEKFGIANPSRNDIIKYRLYKELSANGYKTLYSGTYIPQERLFSKDFDVEHIIPQARLFDDSFANKTLEAKDVNIQKGSMTAYDYVKSKYGEEGVAEYKSRIQKLLNDKAISKTKAAHLLMSEKDIPEGFIERDLRDSQYIAKKAKEMLEEVVKFVVPTTGSVTARLREDWQLVDVMKELNWDKYCISGLTETYQDKDGQTKTRIIGWTKRNDHRHHAMDALTIAFTKRSYIQYLNNLNARVPKSENDPQYVDLSKYGICNIPKDEQTRVVRYIESTQLYRDDKGRLRFLPPMPLDQFRKEAKRHIGNILVSIKAKNKVVTRNVNRTKKKGGYNEKVQLTPRGQLHNETVYGSIYRYVPKEETIGSKFNIAKIETVASPVYREALRSRLAEYGNDPKKAFTGKNALDKNPIFLDMMHTRRVPDVVKTVTLELVYTARKEINPTNFKDEKTINKIIDVKIRNLMLGRLAEYGGDAKKAFPNLDENPIWLNKDKGIAVKRVTITGVSNAIPLHDKRNLTGAPVLDAEGNRLPVDYISTSSNHHIAIFMDEDGNLQEHVVSFYEAVMSATLGYPVIDKEYRKGDGWVFLFTMKQNEYFVFPNEKTGFNPNEIDLMNPDNYALISPNLFRVQKLATKDYFFRHHLETSVEDKAELRDVTWKRISKVNGLKGIVKVRVNHLGQIVQVGEY